jgi:hypothetical protein
MDMARFSSVEAFYASEAYINFRIVIILQRGVRCEKCGCVPREARSLHLHHKIELTPDNINDVMVTLNPQQVIMLCHDCHDEQHKRFAYAPVKRVFIVYGAPCSGKTTYVQNAIVKGDLVVDMNTLFHAVSGMGQYDKPNVLLQNVYAMHNALIDNIKVRYGKWYTAYVIGGYADKSKRERLADELGAELVYCEATEQQCIDRLIADPERPNKEEWKQYIRKWYEEYRA